MTKVSAAFDVVIDIWIKMLNQLSFTFRHIITLEMLQQRMPDHRFLQDATDAQIKDWIWSL
ncbi:hypothetical protein IKF02_01570 [Candidatus Saccharibacteria bacterium]|nr:hypothetical protein [Candidatus Saccharibacteria bacterium]MBR2710306.1 hypothetical protein [Candidatus Saccharibacteria bacterium]